jgi:Glycosyl hydrolases family 16
MSHGRHTLKKSRKKFLLLGTTLGLSAVTALGVVDTGSLPVVQTATTAFSGSADSSDAQSEVRARIANPRATTTRAATPSSAGLPVQDQVARPPVTSAPSSAPAASASSVSPSPSSKGTSTATTPSRRNGGRPAPTATQPSSSPSSAPTGPPSRSTTAPPASSSPIPPTASANPGSGQPTGPGGSWKLVFNDEFNGTNLDRTRWTDLDGWSMNGVKTRGSNVAVTGGNLVLTLSSSSEGAEVDSSPADGAGANGFLLQVGDYAEARINFPGDGRRLYNWPAWWASGPGWPAAGEHDIAEVLGGENTVNYHSSSGAHNQGAVPGYWGGAYHVYGVHRLTDHADVYWDGTLVKSYRTDDNGQGQALLVNVGTDGSPVTGAASQVKVDWIRAYRPAS